MSQTGSSSAPLADANVSSGSPNTEVNIQPQIHGPDEKESHTLNAFLHDTNSVTERVVTGDMRSKEEHQAKARLAIEDFDTKFAKK